MIIQNLILKSTYYLKILGTMCCIVLKKPHLCVVKINDNKQTKNNHHENHHHQPTCSTKPNRVN